MQYVRSISGSVSKTWNSINPATLSGAIDVIVVQHEDGTLACSPFHVRFGKFSLLRPHEKKVEFKVNDVKREFPMKLGEGGEAFFVFETTTSVPEAMQTSPLVSPVTSPEMRPTSAPSLSEADPLELTSDTLIRRTSELESQSGAIAIPGDHPRTQSDAGSVSASFTSLGGGQGFHLTPPDDFPAHLQRSNTDHSLPADRAVLKQTPESPSSPEKSVERPVSPMAVETPRSSSPLPASSEEAKSRAINLSKKLWTSNIPSHVTDQGDLMLDMTGYKSSEEEALRAEVIARKILSDELEGDFDIGSLIGADEKGNLWIYSSEEAKEQASRKLTGSLNDLSRMTLAPSTDAISDPGYHSDDARSETLVDITKAIQHMRHDSDSAVGMLSPQFPPDSNALNTENSKSYAKTLRLTSDQLKDLELKPGQNSMAFTVNRATCTASLWLWRYDAPIVISDIDGTITKSDALGHVLNMIGRDWTHLGVAKLYTEIAANGYNFLYLTSRSVGQADTTRAYLNGVMQEGYKLPKGPTIMSPDRTMAALRREVYLRKPEVFKMACLRDIMSLFSGTSGSRAMFVDPGSPTSESGGVSQTAGGHNPTERNGSPFYAGFGNRLTDAISYRSVKIPSTRIFTINTSSEVSIDLVSLSKYRTGYSSMREIVDHFFPPVDLLVKGGGEEFTDFTYWRDRPLDIEDFSASESEDDDVDDDDELDEDEDGDIEDDEDEEIDEEEDERSYIGRTPAFTPGVLSEDEYATMGESYFSTGGRPSLDHSVMGESMHSAKDTMDGEESVAGSVLSEGSKRAKRRRRRKLLASQDEGQDDDEEPADGDEDVTASSLRLDEQQKDVQRELRNDLDGLVRTISVPIHDEGDEQL